MFTTAKFISFHICLCLETVTYKSARFCSLCNYAFLKVKPPSALPQTSPSEEAVQGKLKILNTLKGKRKKEKESKIASGFLFF